ncbi:MAG: RNA polymerase sigma factor [Saprospiraceae bacterium]|nr:RNA polymerase sigma factor [Lewinella sp.]
MDRKKLEEALEKLHPQSFTWALRCCRGDRESAADVLQNTYLKILEGKARYQGQSGLKTWLFSIIRFTAIDHYRVQSRRSPHALEAEEQLLQISVPGTTSMEPSDQQLLLIRALNQLSVQQQQVLHLVFYQECTIEEAAEVMRISLGTARTHYERGKRHLRERLTAEIQHKKR